MPRVNAAGQVKLPYEHDLRAHPCPCWCGRAQWRVHFRTSEFALLSCECGGYRIDPPVLHRDVDSQTFYTAYYENSSQTPTALKKGRRTHRFWEVVRNVPAVGVVGRQAADIGCGDGHLCADLYDAGWSYVVGLDVSKARITRARLAYPDIEFHDEPLQSAGLPERSFDLIVLDNVIEHLPDPQGMLRVIYRHLSAEGRLVVITPNMESGQFRLLRRFWTPELAPHVHIFLFTESALDRLLAAAGFAVETVGSFHVPTARWGALVDDVRARSLRRAIWHGLQKAGDTYSRLIGCGPMLYAVARPLEGAADQ